MLYCDHHDLNPWDRLPLGDVAWSPQQHSGAERGRQCFAVESQLTAPIEWLDRIERRTNADTAPSQRWNRCTPSERHAQLQRASWAWWAPESAVSGLGPGVPAP